MSNIKSIVQIPCLNEEAGIGLAIDQIKKQIPKCKIIVYDNGSTDNSVNIAKKNGAEVRFVSKKGKGNVVRKMFSDPLEAEYFIMIDGDNTYDVELALAGFNKDDIEVEYKENMLTVKSKKQDEAKDEDGNVIHRGISKRMFNKSFTIANDVEVKGAELKDGLLKVSLERIIPEHKKAKTIDIK